MDYGDTAKVDTESAKLEKEGAESGVDTESAKVGRGSEVRG